MISATNLVIRHRFGAGPVIALNAHGDVVPPGDGWSADPYGAEIRDGFMIGRGAAVSKSDFATYAFALKALIDSGATLAGTVELHLTYDEETGGLIGPGWLLKQGIVKPDYAICAGFSYSITTAHNGAIHLEVTVRGKSAHAARPDTGHDALEAATAVLNALYGHRAALRDPQFTETVVTRAFTGRYARALRNRFIDKHDAHAVFGFPHAAMITAPLQAAAVKLGDPHGAGMWTGAAFRNVRTGSAADIVREHWDLGSKPAPNLVHLLEAHGVRVFSLGVDHTDVDAFSFWHDGSPYVFLNTAKSAEDSRFDAAHELGHLVLHGGGRPLDGVDVEAEADAFASAMLMPDVDVLTYVPEDPTRDQVLRACPRWRVSPLALTRRLRELRQVGDDVYQALCAELARVDAGGEARESSQLLAKVFRALREQGVTPHELAAELLLSTQELNNIVFGLVVTALPGSGLGRPSGRGAHLRLV